MALLIGNLVLALADAASSGGPLFVAHRKIYWIITAVAGGVLTIVLTVPPLARLFKLAAPDPTLLGLALLVAIISGGFGLVRRLFQQSRTEMPLGQPT